MWGHFLGQNFLSNSVVALSCLSRENSWRAWQVKAHFFNFFYIFMWHLTYDMWHITNTSLLTLPLNYWGNSAPKNVLKRFFSPKKSKDRVKIKRYHKILNLWMYVFNSLQLQYFSITLVILHQFEIYKRQNALEFNSRANGVLV